MPAFDQSIIELARLELARVALRQTAELSRALRQATEVAANTIDVDRAGVWILAGPELRCLHQFVRSRDEHSEGATIELATIPAYVRAIHERRVLRADDALTHPATRELAEGYLVPLGITSMLDSPIFKEGDVVGVICLEHVGPARTWTSREIDFASSVADIVAVVFEQEARLEAEAKQRAAEAQVERARRMEALVRMGAHLAHDFKNVLQAISLGSDALRASRDPKSLDDLARYLGDEARNGARLVDDLLAFCREQSRDRTKLDFVAVVRDLETRLRTLLGERCALAVDLPEQPLFVVADAAQVERVVTNLVINARDAMPEGGTATVRLSPLVDPHAHAHALLEVNDEGHGMDEETRDRVFEPFYTTKPSGKGTGLGLAAVLGIVEQNAGRISVESAVGEGSVFRVTWPLAS